MPTEASSEIATAESPTVNAVADPSLLSPGQMLCAARKQQHLTQREVSDSLHITVQFVNAIEKDEYNKLPGAIFAKGYVKRYAEIMSLDEAIVLAAYDAHVNINPTVIASGAKIVKKSLRTRRSLWARTGSIMVFTGLFLVLWLLKNRESGVSDVSEDPARISQSGDFAGLAQPLGPISVVPPNNSLVSGVAAEDVSDAQALSLENSKLAPVGEQAPKGSTDQIEVDEENTSGMGIAKTLIFVTGEGGDALKLSFSGKSWVEVTDSSDGRKYRDLRVAGDRLEVKGMAPFKIFLGDASRTRLIFNGDEIDFSQEIRIDNSVQLTVGF